MDLFFPVSKILGFVAVPSNALVLVLVAGLVASGRRFGRRLAAAAAAALFVAGLSPLGNWLILPLEQRFPRWDASAGAPDGVIVLGGTLDGWVFGERGDLALNEAAERVTEAVQLARRYPRARIVFSGGEGVLVQRGRAYSEAAAAEAFFVAMGLPPGRVEVEDRSRNTEENAAFSKAMVQPKTGERWLLVTSAWHMPRAIGCFRAAGFAVEAYPVDFRTVGWVAAGWPFFSVSDGLRRIDVAVREWLGLAVYRATNRTAELFPAP